MVRRGEGAGDETKVVCGRADVARGAGEWRLLDAGRRTEAEDMRLPRMKGRKGAAPEGVGEKRGCCEGDWMLGLLKRGEERGDEDGRAGMVLLWRKGAADVVGRVGRVAVCLRCCEGREAEGEGGTI